MLILGGGVGRGDFDEFHSLAILCAQQLLLPYSCTSWLFQLQFSLLLVTSISFY